MTAAHSRLPTELFEVIIDQSSNDPRTLRVLVLICKALLPRSRLHLFKCLVIRSKAQLDSAAEFLDARPWLRLLVRHVRMAPTEIELDSYMITHVFPIVLFFRLPKLTHWELVRLDQRHSHFPPISFNRATLTALRCRYGGSIRRLDVTGIPFPAYGDLARFVQSFLSLRTLYLRDVLIAKATTSLGRANKQCCLTHMVEYSFHVLNIL